MCGCATSNSQVHRVLRIDRPCGRITCRRTQSIQNIRMHIACFEFTAPLDEFHAAVCSYMPRTHGQKQDEFSCTSHALNSPSVWTNHMQSRATNSTKNMHTQYVLRIHRLSGRIVCRCLLLHVAHAWTTKTNSRAICMPQIRRPFGRITCRCLLLRAGHA